MRHSLTFSWTRHALELTTSTPRNGKLGFVSFRWIDYQQTQEVWFYILLSGLLYTWFYFRNRTRLGPVCLSRAIFWFSRQQRASRLSLSFWPLCRILFRGIPRRICRGPREHSAHYFIASDAADLLILGSFRRGCNTSETPPTLFGIRQTLGG